VIRVQQPSQPNSPSENKSSNAIEMLNWRYAKITKKLIYAPRAEPRPRSRADLAC